MLSNPFKADIFPDGFPVLESASLVHAAELDQLVHALDAHLQRQQSDQAPPEGTVVLLKAPRAGYGKSHLLAALRQKLQNAALLIAPAFELESEFQWTSLFWQSLDDLHLRPAAKTGLTQLDQLARHLFGLLNAELIREKRVPCSNPEIAIAALQQRSLELFDLNDPRQAVGRWFAEHFERLLPVNGNVLARFSGLTQEAACHWLRSLCAYTQGVPDGDALRFEQLRWALQQGHSAGMKTGGMNILTAPTLNESYYQARLIELLKLSSLSRPVVLLFDHLDAIHGHAPLTMRVASVVAEFRRLVPRALSVLSVNQDLWSGSFQKFIPSALEDRLTSELIHLREISADQGIALIRQRLRDAGVSETDNHDFLSTLQLPQWFAREPGRFSAPRSLFRHAARAWDDWTKRALVAPPVTPPSTPAPQIEMPQEEAAGEVENALPVLPSGLSIAAAASSNSFQQLKVMLEKLRQERLSAGKVAPRESTSGTILPDPAPPAQSPEAPPEAKNFVIIPETAAQSISTQFSQLRTRLLQARSLRVDQDLLCHLIGFGGKKLAVIKASHIPVPGSTGPGAMIWQTPDGEILFGTEPHEDRTYWQALLAHARQRNATATQGHSHVAIFSASQEPIDLQWWLPASDATAAVHRYIDVIELDPDGLATLYAADELIHAAEHQEVPTSNPDEIFEALAAHLEPFWKRLTRVLS
jgi:hypothetical protein